MVCRAERGHHPANLNGPRSSFTGPGGFARQARHEDAGKWSRSPSDCLGTPAAPRLPLFRGAPQTGKRSASDATLLGHDNPVGTTWELMIGGSAWALAKASAPRASIASAEPVLVSLGTSVFDQST
jgi:hypothetical protein